MSTEDSNVIPFPASETQLFRGFAEGWTEALGAYLGLIDYGPVSDVAHSLAEQTIDCIADNFTGGVRAEERTNATNYLANMIDHAFADLTPEAQRAVIEAVVRGKMPRAEETPKASPRDIAAEAVAVFAAADPVALVLAVSRSDDALFAKFCARYIPVFAAIQERLTLPPASADMAAMRDGFARGRAETRLDRPARLEADVETADIAPGTEVEG